MIQVEWEIGKKKPGNYLTPFDFRVLLVDSEDLRYDLDINLFTFVALPNRIYFAGENANPDGIVSNFDLKRDRNFCGSTNVIWFRTRINTHTKHLLAKNGLGYLVIYQIQKDKCPAGRCSGCRAFLPRRPGVPDYSDFEAAFMQLAHDIFRQWNKAVMEAKKHREYEGELVTATSENYLSILQTNQPKE